MTGRTGHSRASFYLLGCYKYSGVDPSPLRDGTKIRCIDADC